MMAIQNLVVLAQNRDSMGYIVQWDGGTDKYHFWYKEGVVKDNRLYRTPLEVTLQANVTRLNTKAQINRPLIQTVLQMTKEGDMFALADQEYDAQLERERKAFAKQTHEALIRGHGLSLYAALKDLVDAVDDGDPAALWTTLQTARETLQRVTAP